MNTVTASLDASSTRASDRRLEHGDVAVLVARDAEGVDVAAGGRGGRLLSGLLGGAGDGSDRALRNEHAQVDEPRGRVELC